MEDLSQPDVNKEWSPAGNSEPSDAEHDKIAERDRYRSAQGATLPSPGDPKVADPHVPVEKDPKKEGPTD